MSIRVLERVASSRFLSRCSRTTGILGLTASLMISVVCGLAFAQSKSASNRDLDLPEEELYVS
jgi:hypothetical protein